MAKRIKSSSPEDGSWAAGNPETSWLSGIIAHELNNIVVPLQLFTDMAATNVGAGDPAAQCFDELRLGIARLTALSIELESLVEASTQIERVSIGDCVLGGEPPAANRASQTRWTCSPTTMVAVDPLYARRAIASLLRTSTSPMTLSISQRLTNEARCSACSAPAAPGRDIVCVQGWGSRGITADSIRNPLQPSEKIRTARQLSLAAAVIYSHRAGAHILLEEEGSLSIALPVA